MVSVLLGCQLIAHVIWRIYDEFCSPRLELIVERTLFED